MKKFLLAFIIAFILALFLASCGKEAEYCWDCSTNDSLSDSTYVNTYCGLTEGEAKEFEAQGTKSYAYKDTTVHVVTVCNKQREN